MIKVPKVFFLQSKIDYSEIIKVDYTELLNCNISVSFAYVVAFCVKYIMNRLAHKIVKKKKEKRVGEDYVHYSTKGVTVYVVSFLSEPVRVTS